MRSLGVQRVLTSPYHPEGNAINERSHRTMSNMLWARLLEGTSSRAWVEKVPGLMLTLNAMVHEPHGFSASMVATGREPALPPDLQSDACASPSFHDPTDYVEVLRQRLSLTHQQMTNPPPPAPANPHQEGSLIFVMTTPPERTNKLTPRWKCPFRVRRVPNPYQVVYEVHLNHTKPAKLAAPDLPSPTPAPESPRPNLGYLPKVLQQPCPRPPPPQAAAPTGGIPPLPTATPPPPTSRRPNRGSAAANDNSAAAPQPPRHPGSQIQPLTPATANQNAGSPPRLRRSARLNPGLNQACSIKGPPRVHALQSQQPSTMARTYPLVISYNQCLGAKDNPCAFSSVCLENLRNSEREYLSTIEQLITALPRTEDPTSRLALRAHITPAGHPRLRHPMRAALWWLLPADGKFRRASHDLHYYLARQGRRVVLRGGNVTQPFYESCVNWVIDPAPPAPHRPVLEESAAPMPAHKMPPSGGEPQPPRCQKSRRRRRRKAARSANQLPASRPADVMTQADPTANSNSAHWRATRPRSEANDQPEMRSTPVKHPLSFTSSPLSQPPISAANQNEEHASCQDHSENLGLYKPAPTDPRQDLTATQPRANNSGFGLSSPTPKQSYTKPFSRLPARPKLTSPHREAGGTYGGRPGISGVTRVRILGGLEPCLSEKSDIASIVCRWADGGGQSEPV